MYRISRARVNIAKKQFSNLSNEYELMFGQETEVEPVDEVRSTSRLGIVTMHAGSRTES